MTTEERVVNLETAVAFYEDNLQKLAELVSEHQLQMHKMEKELERLRKQLGEMQPSMVRDADEEAPPPHY